MKDVELSQGGSVENEFGIGEAEGEIMNEQQNFYEEGVGERPVDNIQEISENGQYNAFNNYGSGEIEEQKEAFENMEYEIQQLKETENVDPESNFGYKSEKSDRSSSKGSKKSNLNLSIQSKNSNKRKSSMDLETQDLLLKNEESQKNLEFDGKSSKSSKNSSRFVKKSSGKNSSKSSDNSKNESIELEHKSKTDLFTADVFGQNLIEEIGHHNDIKLKPPKKPKYLAASESSASESDAWKLEFPSQDLIKSNISDSQKDKVIKELESKLKQYEQLFKKQNHELENIRKKLRQNTEGSEMASRIE